MATSITNTKLSSHARSISLPSSSHPLITNVEEHLRRLKSFGDASSSSSHTLACQKLDGVKKLYECVDDVLQLPLSQQVLSHERSGKWEEEVLDGSLRLLDICGAVRDIYSQMKESVHELESSLRRKRCGFGLVNEVETYMISNRQLNKMICKCYREMRKAEDCSSEAVKRDSETVPLVYLMKQIQEVSVGVLESTLSWISPSRSQSSRGWSLVSKLLQQKRSSSSPDAPAIEKIQVELHLLTNAKKSSKDGEVLQMQNVVKTLEEMDSSIQKLAEVLDIVFRLLLKTRVSLLNILNH